MTFSSMKAIYEELKSFGKREAHQNNQAKPPCHQTHQSRSSAPSPSLLNFPLRKTLSKDRNSIRLWKDTGCCCQQRAHEAENNQRKLIEENVELRRLCLYLDKQRINTHKYIKDLKQQLQQFQQQNQVQIQNQRNCCYQPCCQQQCDYKPSCYQISQNNIVEDQYANEHYANANESLKWSESPERSNDEGLLAYIKALEERVLTLEDEKNRKVEIPEKYHPINALSLNPKTVNAQTSISQTLDTLSTLESLRSNSNSILSDESYTPQAATENDLERLRVTGMETSNSTLTGSGTTYGSSSFDDDAEEDISIATTVYRGLDLNNNSDTSSTSKPQTAATLVRKFMSTREAFLQTLRQKVKSPDYAIIRRRSAGRNSMTAQDRRKKFAYTQRSYDYGNTYDYGRDDSDVNDDLPPKLELISKTHVLDATQRMVPTQRLSA